MYLIVINNKIIYNNYSHENFILFIFHVKDVIVQLQYDFFIIKIPKVLLISKKKYK